MGLMGKLFGKDQQIKEVAEPALATLTSCPHTTLVPRWDNAADIGHEDRATGFRCDACGQMFSPEEAANLRRSEADRLRETVASEPAATNP